MSDDIYLTYLMPRVVKLVAEGDLEGERKRMVDVVCTHVFSLVPKGALNRDGGVPQTPPRKSMLAGMRECLPLHASAHARSPTHTHTPHTHIQYTQSGNGEMWSTHDSCAAVLWTHLCR